MSSRTRPLLSPITVGGMQTSILGSLSDTGGRSPVEACVQNLAQLRDEGFRRVWWSQLPYEPDLLTVLAVALREVDTIEVASGVLPIQIQHPMQLAQRALTVDLIGGGRFILGIGASHQLVTEEMWGIPFDKPVRRMREYLDGLLPLLAGKAADAVGETVTTRGALQIPGAPTPDVYIAALGPQMLRLAGRRSAGTVTWMTGPRTLAEHITPTLRQAAADAGRPETAVRVVAALPVSVTDDVTGARARAAEQFAMYGQLPSYRAMLDREGLAGPEDVAMIGDEQTVADRVDELRAAGVDELVGVVFEASAEVRARTRALLREHDG
jgi:5,10-methylenetetrahydromethanopterin reductase